ncbi:metallophosphoesterase family protein [Methylobacillus sp.]|uniref:metallophosphoesterase family protein n=1 Tax=Methylobacillus sp. TaxID=56818 RepID=UPI0012CCF368|nr:metallophosphoesterase family protein [Methylobacillus sp.]MPS48479.1 serine/threonine protein phosphatase [Methylobacillus sp.]
MSRKPWLILSDLHLHNWQSFSRHLESGINNRLAGLLSEIRRAADELKARGGDTIYLAGDIYHVRGSVAPSVVNPTEELFQQLIAEGFKVRAISGNHDLEGKHSSELGSSVTSLEKLGVTVCHRLEVFDDDKVVMIPWFDKLDDLRAEAQKIASSVRAEYDLIIHAPLNGIITGLPDHGLSTQEVQSWGYRNVFIGHHHNHKEAGPGVWSIGALAHHTWSDVDSKAGFVIVEDGNKVNWLSSHLPKFVDIVAEMSAVEAELSADGNYVRIKIIDNKNTTVEQVREWMTNCGAVGVVIQPFKQAVTQRDAAVTHSISAGASIEQSVSDFVKASFDPSLVEEINLGSQKVLARVAV